MGYQIPAKPTLYNGRLYRSKLEARWSSMFDAMGWKYEYEPTEINGRHPDFFIYVNSAAYPGKIIITEVKPLMLLTQKYMEEAISAYADSHNHILFLTEKPFYKSGEYCCIGKGCQHYLVDGPNKEPISTEIIDFEMKGLDDFGSTYMSFDGMVSGLVDRKFFIDYDSEESKLLIHDWQRSANNVMFLNPLQ